MENVNVRLIKNEAAMTLPEGKGALQGWGGGDNDESDDMNVMCMN